MQVAPISAMLPTNFYLKTIFKDDFALKMVDLKAMKESK